MIGRVVSAATLLLAALIVAPPSSASRTTEVRVVTANIYVGLSLDAARHDLRLAMRDADVVLTQEQYGRQLGIAGWARYQPTTTDADCDELATYWRLDVWRFRYAWNVRLIPGPLRFPHSVRCATVVRLENRATGDVFGFVDGHMIPHVETAGRPRFLPDRIDVYSQSMERLDLMTERVSPSVVGADWNVACRGDRLVQFGGFPYAHLHDAYRDACAGAPTLPGRHVDTIWTRDCELESVDTIRGTFSDHDFSRVVAGCEPTR